MPAGLLAMEMEGAGAAVSAALGGRECLVVRGVSDYGDARKSDLWQPYASMTAAAYVRALLEALGPADGQARAKPVLMELVELMERVPSLQTPGDREEVLRLMGPPVASRVSQDRRARMALISLARICLDQPAGFETLIGALVELEGSRRGRCVTWPRRSSDCPTVSSRIPRRAHRRRRRPIRLG